MAAYTHTTTGSVQHFAHIVFYLSDVHFSIFQTPDHQGGVHQQTKYDMHIGAKEYHVQNIETRWFKSSRLVCMRIRCSYGCRRRDAECAHSRKGITQLLAISIAY